MDVQQPLAVPIFLQWVNGLTIPALLGLLFAVKNWYNKKEEAAKAAFNGVMTEIDVLKTNHIHHLQLTLDDIKTGQEKMADAAERHKGEIVAALASSQTAIVQAILTLK
jgi:hypothetical protein